MDQPKFEFTCRGWNTCQSSITSVQATRFSALGGSPPTRITFIYASKQKYFGNHLQFYPDHFLPDHKQTIYNQDSIWCVFGDFEKIEHFTLRITHYILHVRLPDAKRKEKVVTGNTNALRASAPGLPCQERNYLLSVSSKILSPLSAEGTSLQS